MKKTWGGSLQYEGPLEPAHDAKRLCRYAAMGVDKGFRAVDEEEAFELSVGMRNRL